MSVRFLRKKNTLPSRLGAAVLAASCAVGAFAADAWQQQAVPMVGVQNYFMERCLQFGAGEKVEFSFTSQHPVNFDVHYHPDNAIVFVLKKENTKELSDSFISKAVDHYCFTWANPVDVGSDWDIQLKYRVIAQ
jgi:hypothetical protein